jgi:hypothetical protein
MFTYRCEYYVFLIMEVQEHHFGMLVYKSLNS